MDALDKAKQRTFQYWFEDGLNEIGLGCLLLFLGLYFYLEATLSESGLLSTILDSSLILVILGGSWLLSRGVKYFKERITYPRTGFVAYAQKQRTPRRLAGGVAGLAGALIAAIVIQGNLLRWLSALTGIVLCLVMVFMGARANLLRFYLLAAIALAIGIAISLGNVGQAVGTSAVYALFGLAVLVSGICSLVRYLRQSSAPEESFHD